MICAHHLAMQAEAPEVDLTVVPSALTIFGGSALCLHCFWMTLNESLPKADDGAARRQRQQQRLLEAREKK